MKYFIFLAMLFCHVIDDFGLQGRMSTLKQKSYWKKETENPFYHKDYIPALIMHSISWTFMIMLPIALSWGLEINEKFLVCYVSNALVHAIVDDQKANRFYINLIHDQTIHVIQIILTYIILVR